LSKGFDMKQTLEIFIEHLNNDEFANAHEVMEKQWKAYKKVDHPKTKLLKGYINGATAFELLKRNKEDGAHRLWAVHEKYLPLLTTNTEEYELFRKANQILQNLHKERL